MFDFSRKFSEIGSILCRLCVFSIYGKILLAESINMLNMFIFLMRFFIHAEILLAYSETTFVFFKTTPKSPRNLRIRLNIFDVFSDHERTLFGCCILEIRIKKTKNTLKQFALSIKPDRFFVESTISFNPF